VETLYPADYTTLTAVKRLKGIATAQTVDDDVLLDDIHQASGFIDIWATRHFVPYVFAKSLDESNVSGYDLDTRDDLLAVTTVTNGDGEAVDSSGYNLRPDNIYPKRKIELISSGAITWGFQYRESRIVINGIWGHHNFYPNAWAGGSALNGSLNDNATNVVVSSGTPYKVLDYILVENEQMQITAISTNTLTVTRGVNGTTAAAHNGNPAAKIYQQNPSIRFCANQIVKWMYENRDKVEGTVQLAEELGVVIVQELPMVKKLLETFRPVTRQIYGV